MTQTSSPKPSPTSKDTEAIYEAGCLYMAAGLSILALSGKSPNGAFHKAGLSPAWGPITDPAAWEKAARHRDTTGVGLVIPPHRCVVDIDGEVGARSFMDLVGEMPDTAIARTGRGLHLWFASFQIVRNMKLGELLDVKGHGGYVCGPPSVHPDLGTTYEWLDPLVVDGPDGPECSMDLLPAPIEAIVAARSQVFRLPKATGGGSLKGLVNHLRQQTTGNRNASLFWASCVAREDGFSLSDALAELVPASVEAGLAAREADRTVRSAFK